MRLALGADHRGASATRQMADRLRSQGHDVTVHGNLTGETCDYPDPAFLVAHAVADGKAEMGVLLCGTGIGTSIAANKISGVRAAVVHDELTAEMSRSHNNANIVCLSADLLGQRLIEKIVDIWLSTPFLGGRHERRIEKIREIEQGRDPSRLG
ncbi:MAG: ribose 5-phosphate isomerase B [Phycisphaerales bacterium]|nr:ribose 5-phosphate isomerase B [Phycisphaerales bacterium]